MLLAAGAAGAQDAPSRVTGPHLWATVNVCDTALHPDTVGIRGAMPGSGRSAERMYVRLLLEYRSAADGTWHGIGPAGDSGWIPAGSGSRRQAQAGRNFTVRPPASGSYRMRGTARFEWRRGTRVVARGIARTSAGHAPTAGADPSGYSAATCDVTP